MQERFVEHVLRSVVAAGAHNELWTSEKGNACECTYMFAEHLAQSESLTQSGHAGSRSAADSRHGVHMCVSDCLSWQRRHVQFI